MKTIILAVLTMFPAISNAADYQMVRIGGSDKNVIGTIIDETALAYNRNGYASIDPFLGRRVSAQVTYTSATLASVQFSSNAWTFPSATITKASHGLYDGIAVLLTQTAGTVPAPLVDQTTYYAIRASANSFKLATTKQNAVDGTAITIGSATYSGTQTYTLAPLAITGTPAFVWQYSNDGTVWNDVNTSSVTMTSYTAGGLSSAWDFEYMDFSTIRLAITGPTTGGIYIRGVINIKE